MRITIRQETYDKALEALLIIDQISKEELNVCANAPEHQVTKLYRELMELWDEAAYDLAFEMVVACANLERAREERQ
jgi:hypothetical protein